MAAVIALGAVLALTLNPSPRPAAAQTPPSFADVAEKASPAVVNISTVKNTKSPMGAYRFKGGGPMAPDDRWREFFERFFGDQGVPRERKERSLGSGFIIDPSGLTVTNNHVVEGADEIMVRMSDDKEYKAEILGRDPKTDLALIKIKHDGSFPFLKIGDSAKVRIGDWVVAIGNPFGLDHTVTAGILSARGRAIGAGPYDDFLQTDASINPGNSGGPLLNLDGEVIGINTAIIAGGQGIGFAIPANMAKDIVSQLKDKGRVVRGWLGVMIQKITPELAKTFKLEGEKGALVADVTDGGPAEKAGLKRGDVIVKFDDKPIGEWSELPTIVAGTSIGAKAKITIIRDGKEKVLTVTVGELTDEKAAEAQAQTTDLGLTVKELTPELAERLGLGESEGVIIAGVADDSAAAESGLKPGDLIVEIDRNPVKDIGEYRKVIVGKKKGDTLLFLIKRGPNTLFFTLKIQ
ncbi:MAG: DegQ family serine endoprotease [Proteobacteria bacterium]|nr:DegQ family serine endoprotease [Pseudomonadota bacterium]